MTDANQTSSRSQGVGFLGVSRSLTTNKNQYKYENQKTKQASQDRRARGECVYRILEHRRWRHTASGHNHRGISITMKTQIIKTLTGIACPSFEEWAEDSELFWTYHANCEVTVYVLDKDSVMSCKVITPYLRELQQAFKDNPEFDSITLDVA